MSEADFLVKVRDGATMIADACEERLEKVTPYLKKQEAPSVVEQTFLCLKFEGQEGQRIGAYDVAYEPQNLLANWTHAMNILKASNAVIEKRYHGPGYQYSYWLFGEHKIYRQKLKETSK